jgi:hypothetical protein
VEDSAGDDKDDRARITEQFLVCAEARYLSYLMLLENFLEALKEINSGDRLIHEFSRTMPLPPWYI